MLNQPGLDLFGLATVAASIALVTEVLRLKSYYGAVEAAPVYCRWTVNGILWLIASQLLYRLIVEDVLLRMTYRGFFVGASLLMIFTCLPVIWKLVRRIQTQAIDLVILLLCTTEGLVNATVGLIHILGASDYGWWEFIAPARAAYPVLIAAINAAYVAAFCIISLRRGGEWLQARA